MKSAEIPSPSSPRHKEAAADDHASPHSSSYTNGDESLPPITTESMPGHMQDRIACQSWDKVSARHPIGYQGEEPDVETFVCLVSTMLETRLADVVKHRIEVKMAMSSRRSSGSLASMALGLSDNNNSEGTILLTSTCRAQLRSYVRRISSMYRDNRYHGLEHAVHVTMSANKLLEMLHEGTVESSSDDEEEQINDFSVSEPHIVSGKNYRPPSKERSSLGINDSEHSAISENELYKPPSPTPRHTSFSQDFDGGNGLRPKRNHKPRSSTYLIYSDVFTKFAFVFAAMIHDVDHQGVPNARLVVEKDPLVDLHGGISVAEKHSIKVAFRTLSEGDFDEFRKVIFESPDDQLQMHRIVSNVVVSTDIASPERMQSTKMRWGEAFSHPLPTNSLPFGRLSMAGQSPLSEIATVEASKPQMISVKDAPIHERMQRRNSLKRVLQLNSGQTVEYFTECDDDDDDDDARTALRHSVVIETMLNVADVAHSMQSWELFVFWNRKLFEELYDAYKSGRSANDPCQGWYKNQIGFYSMYVIPLAEKMEKCGVFGELGGEWVKNAKLIRDRWTREGEEVTEDMIASVKREFQ